MLIQGLTNSLFLPQMPRRLAQSSSRCNLQGAWLTLKSENIHLGISLSRAESDFLEVYFVIKTHEKEPERLENKLNSISTPLTGHPNGVVFLNINPRIQAKQITSTHKQAKEIKLNLQRFSTPR